MLSLSKHAAGFFSNLPESAGRKVAIDYLRTFIIVLVLVHHSVLAYVSFGQFDRVHYLSSTAPIVDSQRWVGFDLIVVFNDIFMMSLMFFVSGLFVWPSLTRKGTGPFLRARLLRLGLPFAVVVTLVMPLAFYPSFRMTGVDPGYLAFWRDTIMVGPWPAGPPWFVAVLLAFDCVAALVHWAAPGGGKAIRETTLGVFSRPLVFFLILVTVSAAAFFPMLLGFGPTLWFVFGPFTVQASRALHYAAYFFAGVAVSAYGLDRSVFVPRGPLARRWMLWALAGLVSFVIFVWIVSHWPPPLGAFGRWFVIACAAISFAFLALFLRFANRRFAIVESLNDNAYGIYLIHYLFVVWLQYALLASGLSPIAKGVIVFATVLTLSWGAVAALRRVRAIANVL
ncbi:MAG TPA: acyltransferase [Candidatus Binatia bacterium]|nr:acyltransferase [Candidatus Binatia bacterium]